MNPSCVYCEKEIESGGYRRIQGWERKSKMPSRRGGSDIAARESLNEYACDSCVDKLQRGVNPLQGTLV